LKYLVYFTDTHCPEVSQQLVEMSGLVGSANSDGTGVLTVGHSQRLVYLSHCCTNCQRALL